MGRKKLERIKWQTERSLENLPGRILEHRMVYGSNISHLEFEQRQEEKTLELLNRLLNGQKIKRVRR